MIPETLTNRELLRDKYLAQLDAVSTDVERIAEDLPPRGSPFPGERIKHYRQQLLMDAVKLLALLEAGWSWHDPSMNPHRLIRADENVTIANHQIDLMEESRLDAPADEQGGLAAAWEAIRRLRQAGRHLRHLLEMREPESVAA